MPRAGQAWLVTRNFPPLLGGMENVNAQLLAALAVEHEARLFGPAGASAHVPLPGVRVVESPLRPLPLFLLATALRAVPRALFSRPALVVAGSGLTAPIAWLAARLGGGKAVVYLHGLDLVAPSRLYQWAWLPFIRRCDLALVNSRHTAGLARERGVPADAIEVLNPGTEVPAADPAAGAAFRASAGLGERPLLLSVGRLTRRKGLAEFVREALPAIVARHPEALLLVIGEDAADALRGHGGSERARIGEAVAALGLEAHVRFLPHCDAAGLEAAYAAADCHVFPVLALPGDVEGFGMVALESAARGLPTVAFAVGGVPDAVGAGVSGALAAPGDYAAFAAHVNEVLDDAGRVFQPERARAFAEGKSWARFGERLRALLRGLA